MRDIYLDNSATTPLCDEAKAKMIEAMESDSKPNILAVGHYHKAEYLFYRNVHLSK